MACRARRRRRARAGQSTVEFAVVLVAFLALAAGLGALWHAAAGGKLAEHTLESASHHVDGGQGAWADVLAY